MTTLKAILRPQDLLPDEPLTARTLVGMLMFKITGVEVSTRGVDTVVYGRCVGVTSNKGRYEAPKCRMPLLASSKLNYLALLRPVPDDTFLALKVYHDGVSFEFEEMKT